MQCRRTILSTMVLLISVFCIQVHTYAANGDLIVNGNLSVGTNTPTAKAEIKGNMIVDGNTTTNGSAVVNGSLGVGTETPQTKLDINGDVSFVINGTRVIAIYIDQNIGEDSYSAWQCGTITDTCGDPVNNSPSGNLYTCLPNEQRNCKDLAFNYNALLTSACPANGYVNRTVACKRPVVFAIP